MRDTDSYNRGTIHRLTQQRYAVLYAKIKIHYAGIHAKVHCYKELRNIGTQLSAHMYTVTKSYATEVRRLSQQSDTVSHNRGSIHDTIFLNQRDI